MKILRIVSAESFCIKLFGIASILFFGIYYDEHLQRLEQLQLFEVTFAYLFNHLSIPGGFTIWLGELFTQFFQVPFAGAVIITGLLILLQQSAKRLIHKVSGNTNLIILTFLPVAGYWILMLADYYCFSGIIGLLISLFTASLYFGIKKENIRIPAGFILVLLLYWLTGGAYLVFSACLIFGELALRISKREKNSIPVTAIFFILILTLAIPLAARQFILRDTLFQAFISEAYFQIRIFFPVPLIIIFTAFPVLLLIHFFLSERLPAKQKDIISFLSPLILAAMFGWGIFHYADFDAEKQIRFENLVCNKEWDKIISIAEIEQPSDQISIMAVNLALAKTGQLSTKMFYFDQHENSLFLNYERRGMTPFIAAEPFYYLGLINFAQMFAMETVESTPDVKYPARSFKLVASTFIINGQYDIALKYLTPLSHTVFYRKWAKECISILYNEEKINSHPEFGELRRSRPRYDFYFNEQQLDLAMLFLIDANPENRTAYEYLMAEYLLKKDMKGFLQNINLARKMNYREMPIVYQEAAAYINSSLPETPPQLLDFPVKNIVLANLKAFAERYNPEDQNAGEKMKKDFGKTYWYYLHFR